MEKSQASIDPNIVPDLDIAQSLQYSVGSVETFQ